MKIISRVETFFVRSHWKKRSRYKSLSSWTSSFPSRCKLSRHYRPEARVLSDQTKLRVQWIQFGFCPRSQTSDLHTSSNVSWVHPINNLSGPRAQIHFFTRYLAAQLHSSWIKISCVIFSELAWAPFSKRGRIRPSAKPSVWREFFKFSFK